MNTSLFSDIHILINSRHWILLLEQITRSIENGAKATTIYSQLDRLPAPVLAELHKVFTLRNWSIEKPIAYLSHDDDPFYQGLYEASIDIQSPLSHGKTAFKHDGKVDFSQQFTKINAVFATFAQNFGVSSESLAMTEDEIPALSSRSLDNVSVSHESIAVPVQVIPASYKYPEAQEAQHSEDDAKKNAKSEAFKSIKQTLGMR